MPKISSNEAAKLLGVSSDTLRRWEEEGKIEPERTEGGHRRYDVATLLKQSERDGKTICYARVSTRPQKADLERQATVLSAYCEQHEWNYEVIRDLGSGLNYNKKGLLKLLTLIVSGDVRRLVITHKDRLMRFGAEFVFSGARKAPPPVYARHSILKSLSSTVQWRLVQKRIWYKMS